MQEFEIIAKTFQGLEEVLAQELIELGANNVQLGRRMVSFTGDKAMLYRANFCLRTAVRVLMPIKHFKAKNADEVYTAVRDIDWSRYLDTTTTFSVDSVVNSSEFRHSKFVAYKVKDAIVDYFRETTGERPNIRITNPDIKLNIHIAEDECTLSLDSSGESLHLRGYRVGSVEAPINEVLAAGLIKLTGWQADCDFIDPFCGSGTFLVEAALIARNIYPGVFRKNFGFENWKDFDRDLLDEIYNDDSQEREFSHRIYGYDINVPAVEVAVRNAKSAGVADIVEVKQQDFRNFKKPAEKSVIVTNPPYGERLTSPDLLNLYQLIGKVLKNEFTGGEAWVISSKQELFENIGLRPSFKVQVLNGSLDCDFRKYQLFEGKLGDFRAGGGKVKTDEERRLMSDSRRFRKQRDDFRQRIGEEGGSDRYDEDDELSQQYNILRRHHREFEQNSAYAPKRERSDFKRERPDFKRERPGFRKGSGRSEGFRKDDKFRKDDGRNRESGSGDYRRKGGFGRRDEGYGQRGGSYGRPADKRGRASGKGRFGHPRRNEE